MYNLGIQGGVKMKKIIPIMLTSVVAFSSFAPSIMASENSSSKTVPISTNVSFATNTNFTDLSLQVPNNSQVPSNSQLPNIGVGESIQPFAYDIGGSSKVIVSPMYRTFSNKVTKAAVDVMVAYIAAALPFSISRVPFFNYLFNTITGWISIKPTYVGTWVTRVWHPRDQMYVYNATLVHYKDSSYKTPLTVQVYEVHRSKTPLDRI